MTEGYEAPPPPPGSGEGQYQPASQEMGPAAAPGYATEEGPSGPRAGFWRRFAAYLIDSIIVSVIVRIVGAILGVPLLRFSYAPNEVRPAPGTLGIVWALSIIIPLAYFSYFEGGPSGQTVGKLALGIRVIDFSTGGALGYGRAALRWVGRIASTIVCFLGYLWMLWDKEKQTWHDKIATSVVVPESAYPVEKWPG